MTKAEIKTLTAFYTKRIESLDYAIDTIRGRRDKATELEIMRREYQFKLDGLSESKEYMINFEGGGWNTTYAKNDEDALASAKLQYGGEHTKVKSVRLATKAGIDAAMRSFY